MIESDLGALDPDKLPSNWRDAVVAGSLRFGFAGAQDSQPVLTGQAAVTIDAVCQRCLEPFQVPVAADLRLLFDSDQATADTDYEVWELGEDKLRPLDLVEEVLVMAMPLAAMHVDDKTCHGLEVGADDSGERIRPFAALKSQMDKDD